MNISIAPEKIISLWHFPLTNSLLGTWLVMIILIVLAWLISKKMRKIPRGWQNIGELVVEKLHHMVAGVTTEKKWLKIFFPLIATFFIYIIILNWFGLFPGIGSIGFYEIKGEEKNFVSFLRAGSSDLNTTLALALISVFLTQLFGIISLGFFKYSHKFINFKSPIKFFTGILELISEISKLISFSFRLFGNIFAGEVLLIIMTVLIPLFIPIPFYALEIFVGFIQALVFAMLSLVFFNLAVQKHA